MSFRLIATRMTVILMFTATIATAARGSDWSFLAFLTIVSTLFEISAVIEERSGDP